MATTKAQTRATRRWRERNNLNLVQVYLPESVIKRLDDFVINENATGRREVIERLILKASKPLHTDTPKELNREPVELPDKDGRCMAQDMNRLRCHHKGIEWQSIPNINRPCNALFCKAHSQFIHKYPNAVFVHSSCLG